MSKSLVIVLFLIATLPLFSRVTTEQDFGYFKELHPAYKMDHVRELIAELNRAYPVNISVGKLNDTVMLFHGKEVYGQLAYLEDTLERYPKAELVCGNISISLFNNISAHHNVMTPDPDKRLIVTDNYAKFPLLPFTNYMLSKSEDLGMGRRGPKDRSQDSKLLKAAGFIGSIMVDAVGTVLTLSNVLMNGYLEEKGNEYMHGIQNNIFGFSQADTHDLKAAIDLTLIREGCRDMMQEEI